MRLFPLEVPMSQPVLAPFGSWRSPISADLIVAGAIGLSQIRLDGDDVYWIEQRPTEAGRNVIVRRNAAGETADVIVAPYNARTRVHEYGGAAYLVDHGDVYFANFTDQRVYRLAVDAPANGPAALTPAGIDMRYADFIMDRSRGRLICVREDHTGQGEAVNTLAALPLDGESAGQVLVAGNDFYASPRLSPDGRRLAWLTWHHPNMPWDGCELWVAEVTPAGALLNPTLVAGGDTESIFEPRWSPAGVLHFVSDRTGWWNLYRLADGVRGEAVPLYPLDAEFGLPQWVFDMSTYTFDSAGDVVCAYQHAGQWHALLLPAVGHGDGHVIPGRGDVAALTFFTDLVSGPSGVYCIAGSPTDALAVIQLDVAAADVDVLRLSSDVWVDPGYLSRPQSIEFPTTGGLTAYGVFYPPANRDYDGPPGERPPLIVMSHGGPTGAAEATFDLKIQYWTSRGLAVLDVNYGGSVGYGRAYRQRLKGNWGVVDVDDCANGARALAQRGWVDGERLAIRGGSAGGYTTLAALIFRNVFKAGASYYGVSDLEALATDTHKFESRYLDGLVGAYPAQRDVYVARSPIHHTERLSVPMILLQGLEDRVVPPSQAEQMFAAVRAKGLPVAYLAFPGEQHGFRQAANIKRSLEAELYFYSRVFGFPLADPVTPIVIENLA
jgi:dienelactone hydrolase